jgi:outer membrane lipase/esterase
MVKNWLCRAVLMAASAALLAGCGSSSIESALTPARFVSFGDAFSDVGQSGSKYTVNDGSTNNWSQQMVGDFGLSLTLAPSSGGGLSYARGNARVNTTPDAAGNSSTLTVKQQVDAFLASNTIGGNDVMIVQGGISDIVAEMAAVNAGTETTAQMLANLTQAGTDLGAQVRRLVQAGAKYVVVVGAYNLGRSPWATAIGQGAFLTSASSQFNNALLVSIVDLGANALYIDAAYYLNLVTGLPGSYSLTDASSVMCTSVDPGPGIGIGANQVNSALCNTSTITSGLNYNLYAFADQIYLTPVVQRLFGDYAYGRLRARW